MISQYASSPGNRARRYAELAVSSPAVAETIACTHYINSRRDGQAEWAWMNTGIENPPKWSPIPVLTELDVV